MSFPPTMRHAFAILAALLVPLGAGCISLPASPEAEGAQAQPLPPDDRIDGMTAESTNVDTVEPCESGNVQVPPGGVCAHRVLTVTGRIGVDHLPVDLSTVNGAVSIVAGPGDAWSFIADIRVRALTEDAARNGLDSTWSWDHEANGQHRLRAAPVPASPATVGALGATLEGASYQIVLPAWATLDVKAVSTNGAMAVSGFRLDGLVLETTNGAITVDAQTPDAKISTTNGAIQAALDPTASGSYTMGTTNGAITLLVPEDRAHGYDAEGRSTNGNVEFALEDGVSSETSTPGSTSVTFETNNYGSRAIQTKVGLETTNGAISVAPSA